MRLQYFNLNNGLTLFHSFTKLFSIQCERERNMKLLIENKWKHVQQKTSMRGKSEINTISILSFTSPQSFGEKKKGKAINCSISIWNDSVKSPLFDTFIKSFKSQALEFFQNCFFRFGAASITWKFDYRTKGKREFFSFKMSECVRPFLVVLKGKFVAWPLCRSLRNNFTFINVCLSFFLLFCSLWWKEKLSNAHNCCVMTWFFYLEHNFQSKLFEAETIFRLGFFFEGFIE